MTELHGTGITPVLAANTELDAGARRTACCNRLLHQRSNTFPIENGKGIRIHDVRRPVKINELGCVVPGTPIGERNEMV